MPRHSDDFFPSCQLHKQSRQAIVTLNYRDHTLGRFATPESKARYHTLIARWL